MLNVTTADKEEREERDDKDDKEDDEEESSSLVQGRNRSPRRPPASMKCFQTASAAVSGGSPRGSPLTSTWK